MEENKELTELIDNLGSPNNEIRFPAVTMISGVIFKILRTKEGIDCNLGGLIQMLQKIINGKYQFREMTYKDVLQDVYDKITQMFESVLSFLQTGESTEFLPLVTRCASHEMNQELLSEFLENSRKNGLLFYDINHILYLFKNSSVQKKEVSLRQKKKRKRRKKKLNSYLKEFLQEFLLSFLLQ